jgi:preprotein translocase subunit SecA
MKTAALPIPGLVLGAYPERRRFERYAPALLSRGLRARVPVPVGRYHRFASRVAGLESELGVLDGGTFKQRLHDIRAAMSREGLSDALIGKTLALVSRLCRQTLGLRPFPTQLMAARIMLDGKLAEMATGEGKTLAAGLCAAVAALAGVPVHVVTANDYLVTRDAAWLQPLYHALGLDVGTVTQADSPSQRLHAYSRDIVYCTAKELAFDYLRDGLMRGRDPLASRTGATNGKLARATLLRGLCMAVIDEADCVLIDEACVPLVLSERRENAGQIAYHREALTLAGRLCAGRDFELDMHTLSAELSEPGRLRLEEETAGLDLSWRNRLHRDESVATALAALHLYVRDRHYLVCENQVKIIDQTTGRLAPGRAWSRGLQQMIEIREGLKPSAQNVPVAQITFQRFFRRYLRLGGMSGTLREARGELQSVYGLPVVVVPLRSAGRRRILPMRLLPDRDAQWEAVLASALEASRAGRPVLIGTDSVAESDALSRRFSTVGVAHALLNARQDEDEARIVGAAGVAGQITIATNMAGRGTDIVLGARVCASGGLHVISCQHNESPRIDRQLIGRCARQGDPGSAQTLLSVDKPLIARTLPRWLLRRIAASGGSLPQWLARAAVRIPQWLEDGRRRNQRRELLRNDLRANRLAPGGHIE